MSGLSSYQTEALVVGVVLSIVLMAVAFFILTRLRRRRDRLRGGATSSPAVASDRAFNRLTMARTEADLLGRQGGDVRRARELIGLAEASFGRREFDRAYDLAQSAHETLVAARRGPRETAAAPPEPGSAAPSGPPLASAAPAHPPRIADPAGVPANAPVSTVPKNRVESQFEIHLLDSELEDARRTRPRQASTKRAEALRAEAQAAYDRSDFTEAFRLALRGRREAGGKVETLAPGPARPVGGEREPAGPGSAGVNPAAVAEEAAGAGRCPQCGHPNLPSDTFCRGCGTPVAPAVCPQCSAARRPIDTFCGRCGQKFG